MNIEPSTPVTDREPRASNIPLFQQFGRNNEQELLGLPLIRFVVDQTNAGEEERNVFGCSEFMHWCAEIGLAPEHWTPLWKAADLSDGVLDNHLQITDKDNQNEKFEAEIASLFDPNSDGVISPQEQARLTGRPVRETHYTSEDHQAERYMVSDLDGDGFVLGQDHDLWDDQWAEQHSGVSFYSDPKNADVRAQAIADWVVAQNKRFTLFGEVHTHHPWQEIESTIQALRANGKSVVYTVEGDPQLSSRYVAHIAAELERDPKQLQDPDAFRAAVEGIRNVHYMGGDKFDYAYSIVSAIRAGAHVEFIDVHTSTVSDDRWTALKPFGILKPEQEDPREIDPITGQRLSRDDIMARRLLALSDRYRDSAFVIGIGAYHASKADYPPEHITADEWANVDCRAVARRLMDRFGQDVLSMNFNKSDNISGEDDVLDLGLYDVRFTLPTSAGILKADSWLAHGWPVR